MTPCRQNGQGCMLPDTGLSGVPFAVIMGVAYAQHLMTIWLRLTRHCRVRQVLDDEAAALDFIATWGAAQAAGG